MPAPRRPNRPSISPWRRASWMRWWRRARRECSLRNEKHLRPVPGLWNLDPRAAHGLRRGLSSYDLRAFQYREGGVAESTESCGHGTNLERWLSEQLNEVVYRHRPH